MAAGVFVLFAAIILAPVSVQAADATLRIISTTDIHNQLSVEYYDNAGSKAQGSLAKVSTLINQARAAVTGASVTVDVGDSIYGYGSDYIYENAPDSVQPIYAAMSEIGYDALTLGNHDFDYGYSYIKKQVNLAGFQNICTVANVYDAISGQNVWKDYLIVQKQCLASDGKYYPIDIAIIGVTRPALSNYSSHTGELTTADMVEVVKTKAVKARENGADVVLVIAHTGIGAENPSELSENEGYALTCIPEVDAVMCGHLHQNFPSTDYNAQQYYNLAGVDERTGLSNGKPLIMIQDRGHGIGVSDLQLKIANDGAVSIKGASAKIVYCDKNTVEDPVILKYKSSFDEKIKETYKETVADLTSGARVENYFGYLQDNLAMQLNNETRIREGLLFKNEKSAYKDYNVIAASTYKKSGSEGKDDYFDINGAFTMKDLLSIQTYNRDYAVIYRITGAQLREWLEWTASVYGYWDSAAFFSDASIQNLITNSGMVSFLSHAWIENWKSFTVFDGIEYEFDMSVAPKYNRYGEAASSSSSRVRSLTCNGQAVTDNMQFLLVTDRTTVYNNPVVGSDILNQRVKNSSTYLVGKLKEYVSELGSYGALDLSFEDNWHVSVGADVGYLIRSSINSRETAQAQKWYQNIVQEDADHIYYQARFTGISYTDTSGPTLVVASTNQMKTNRDIKISVQATDQSGVAALKYARGEYKASDSVWNTANAYTITGGSFIAADNAVYTICAADMLGNATVKHIKIGNIDRTILQVPDLDSYTNKKAALTGTAEPNATIYVELGDMTYTAQTSETGDFSCELPYQKSGTVFYVYVMDSTGRKSDKVEVTVVRNGPNHPDVDGLTNKGKYITGMRNDEAYCQIFAIIGSKVYVNENGGRDAYMNSTRYNASKTIVETSYTVTDGKFSLKVAVQDAEKDVKVFSVDTIGRVSAVSEFTVTEVAPNKPTVYKICDVETAVYGKIPKAVSGCAYLVTVETVSGVYTGSALNTGHFCVPVGNLEQGSSVSVVISDEVDGKVRKSAKTNSDVIPCQDYVGNYGYIVFDTITDKDTTITGHLLASGYDTIYVKVGNRHETLPIDSNREFKLSLDAPLEPGTRISAVLRELEGQLTDTAITEVTKAPADQPTVLTSTIYNTSKTLQVLSEEECTACVKIGSQLFTSDKAEYSVSDSAYCYTIKMKNLSAREAVSVYMLNEAGKSKPVNGVVKGRKPEIRKVNKITYKKKKLTGRVGLYLSPEKGNKTPTVNNTGTKVYAKTGGKIYEGKVKKDGTFWIKFPAKLKQGKKIKVYAVNDFGGKGKIVVTTVK